MEAGRPVTANYSSLGKMLSCPWLMEVKMERRGSEYVSGIEPREVTDGK